MKSLLRAPFVVLLLTATPAIAAGGSETGPGWMAILFLFFGALIVAFQAVPGMVLFFSMVKTLFSSKAVSSAHSGMKN